MDTKKLTQEELNALSPRARKAYENSDSVISEILVENPNKDVEIDSDEDEEEDSKEEDKNEEL
jgi:hypothetical protein